MSQTFQERKDLMTRIAGDFAKLDDEAIVRKQPKAGTGISIEWTSDDYMVIHSTVTAGSGGESIRQLFGKIDVNLLPTEDAVAAGWTIANNRDHTVYYMLIHHNWALSDRNAFIATFTDIINPDTDDPAPHSKPRVVGIDENTLIIWAWHPGSNGSTPQYAFTIMEKA